MTEEKSFKGRCLTLGWIGILCLLIAGPEVVAAEKFPQKPIKIFVGFTAGGTADLQTRMLASLMTEDLGQPVMVVNKPGGAATIAAAEVAASKPDGYTLGSFPILVASLTPFFVKVKYDPVKGLDPLIGCWAHPYGICVQQKAPWKSFKELMEFGRKSPGELSVSTPGAGTPQHVAFEWIARSEKIQYKHVPYPGGLPAATALLGGHVKVNFGSGSHLPFLDSGEFRMLASYSPARDPKYPDVPTLKELGYDLPASRMYFISGPKGMPEQVSKTLDEALNKAVRHEAYKELLKKIMLDYDIKTGEEMRRMIESEYRAWDELTDKLGLKAK